MSAIKRQHATFIGTLSAYAAANPLQTVVELVLTDFLPNKNGQIIPLTEADNIITSAKHMPIKINFRDGKEHGHVGAFPIGTLSDVWFDEQKIKARSIIWNNEYPEVDYYLKEKTANNEPIYTSWEIYYTSASEQHGYQALHDTIFAGTCIVDNPAYGTRTPILSVAERQNMEEAVTQEQSVLYALSNLVRDIEAVLHLAYADAVTPENIAERLTRLVTVVAERDGQFAEAQQQIAQLTPIVARVDALEQEVAHYRRQAQEAEQARQEQALVDQRLEALSQVGMVYTPEQKQRKRGFLLAMSESVFNDYLKELKALQTNTLPEPLHSGDRGVSYTDFKAHFQRRSSLEN